MEWTGLNSLREKYLSFFESKDHLRHKSFPLVPVNDKSLLLINAGMAPLKKYFTGELEPPRRRMATCQKCIRTPDIERVGITARHGTFFEMLGNFSFGDYFKKEAIAWAWEFITEWLKLPIDRLWVSIYLDDDEAFEIWSRQPGLDVSRIVRLGKEDNFWEIGSGPCGPCSEIHFDRGEKYGCGSPDCKPGCDCDRFMEFWNLVFTQFDGDGNGNYTPLASPNIDTGMGLERLACLMQGVNNLFEVDTMRNIMLAISAVSATKYGEDSKSDISLRVITDHIRSTTFLISDGVVPSNEGRGYVLRRLLRRAARHGRLLGIKGTFLADICDVVARENIGAYPELTEKLGYIKRVVRIEEERFAATIDSGLNKLDEIMNSKKNDKILTGEEVFRLNDTFGFPIDLTREIAKEQGFELDEDGFKALMQQQKERARAARASAGDFGWSDNALDFLGSLKPTEFTGYGSQEEQAEVLAIVDRESSDMTGSATGGEVIVILDKTPFYAESGGQVGDTGTITSGTAEIKITDTKKHNGIYMHFGTVVNGELLTGSPVTAKIDACRRDSIRRNHSSAHLLQSALRAVLGSHVEQAGSYVDDVRVRFDFTHYTALTQEEIKAVEDIVNSNILAGAAVYTVETDVDTAKTMGAIALFGEKYGSLVRVIKMGSFSTELCGGTHIDNTAKIGLFKIISETSVAAGVRRIEGTTGLGVLELIKDKDALIHKTAHELKTNNPADIADRAAQLQSEFKAASREIESLNSKIALAQRDELVKSAEDINGLKLIVKKTEGITADIARTICDSIKSDLPSAVVVISTNSDGKLNFVVACGKDAVAKGAHAGNIVKRVSAVAGGNGGGRPDSAVAGGKDATKVDAALSEVKAALMAVK